MCSPPRGELWKKKDDLATFRFQQKLSEEEQELGRQWPLTLLVAAALTGRKDFIYIYYCWSCLRPAKEVVHVVVVAHMVDSVPAHCAAHRVFSMTVVSRVKLD